MKPAMLAIINMLTFFAQLILEESGCIWSLFDVNQNGFFAYVAIDSEKFFINAHEAGSEIFHARTIYPGSRIFYTGKAESLFVKFSGFFDNYVTFHFFKFVDIEFLTAYVAFGNVSIIFHFKLK